ncbi:hypothetical protein BDZ94DRAFT_1118262, partial [Collybia nuda]
FPPAPPSQKIQHSTITNFCTDTSPKIFMETGCTVCGKLTLCSDLQKLKDLDLDL